MSTTTNKGTTKKGQEVRGIHGRGKGRDESARQGAKGGRGGGRGGAPALAAMSPDDRALGQRVHAIVKETAPDLTPKTWYGMPAYANKDGKVVLYFRNAEKFKERYAMLGFNDTANLDDGSMWPVAFALTKLTKADEARIAKLLKQAVS